MFKPVVDFIRELYQTPKEFIPLHEPKFLGNEKKYLEECIDSTYVSSVGKFVDRFEEDIKRISGTRYAVATSNGTSALHMALILAGVEENDLVISQPLTFIATCNAISYLKASPLFIDIDKSNLGLCPLKLEEFLSSQTNIDSDGKCIHTSSKKRISACVPMHTFGMPAKIEELVEVCRKYNIPLVEDAAESIGSSYNSKQTGSFGLLGIYSFNGNKIVTCGGGGVIVTNNEELGRLGKHLTTQAKVPHKWNFEHDSIGYNYRMPNLNAALACAQLEQLDAFIVSKREIAHSYKEFFNKTDFVFMEEQKNTMSNYWLNSILLKNREERDAFLTFTNDNGVMTRPVWNLMNSLPMFNNAVHGNLDNAIWVEERLVNIPSSATLSGS